MGDSETYAAINAEAIAEARRLNPDLVHFPDSVVYKLQVTRWLALGIATRNLGQALIAARTRALRRLLDR